MCGIVGYATIEPGSVDAGALEAACSAMQHRGPDGQGLWRDDLCGLGHRRLSIIDLEGGAQPMSYGGGRYWITFNGEIYNYRELRSELATRGHRFRTTSDTEVILAGFAEWGADAAARLRGIFAYAIWDREERTLVLARDHVGVKPLLYACLSDRIVFSSELKGILATGLVSSDVDPLAVSDYLALGYTLGRKTIVRAVNRLDPGSILVWRNGQAAARRFWTLAQAAQEPASPGSIERQVDEYRERLHEAVTVQMVSDVPVGAFLSGGLDSSSVVYHMQSGTEHALRTFSMGFAEKSYSELDYAERVATALGTDHHSEIVGAQVPSSLPDLVRAFDEPLGDTSIVPTYFVSRLARQHVKVVLSGDGADETLAGYDTYAADALQRRYRRLPAWLHEGIVLPASRLVPDSRRKVSLNYRFKQFVGHAHGDWRRAHYGWRLLFDDPDRRALLGGAAGDHDPFTEYRSYFDQVEGAGELNQTLFVDISTWLVNDILTKVDRASMSVGLEARVPFLDPLLMEFSMRLPATLKMDGFKRKVVLRRAMSGRIPESVLRRTKRGFNAPVSDWLRGSLRPVLDELLSSGSRLVDTKHPGLQSSWEDHLSGRADHGFRLWALTSLLMWERVVLREATSGRLAKASTIH